jgi:hypothetical protein
LSNAALQNAGAQRRDVLSLPAVYWNSRTMSGVFIVMGPFRPCDGAAFGFTRDQVSRGHAWGVIRARKIRRPTMMRISTLITALAVGLAVSSLATPSFAQRSEGMSSDRVSSIHDCTTKAGKYKQYVWGDYQIDKYRACMTKHDQEE